MKLFLSRIPTLFRQFLVVMSYINKFKIIIINLKLLALQFPNAIK